MMAAGTRGHIDRASTASLTMLMTISAAGMGSRYEASIP